MLNNTKLLLREVNKLDNLGSSQAIADYLNSHNVKGYRRKTRACPLYNYFTKVCGFDFISCLDQHGVSYLDVIYCAIDFNSNLFQFVVDFDDRKYPSLIS